MMSTLLHKSLFVLLVLLVSFILPGSPEAPLEVARAAPGGEAMPADLMQAFLEASAQPITAHAGQVQAGDREVAHPLGVEALRFFEEQKVVAAGAVGNAFGLSVALDGDTALVGSPADTVGSNTGQGSAYIFTWNGLAWSFQQRLVASEGKVNSFFGRSVALDGETAIVGAHGHGETYVFTRSGTAWTERQKLTTSDGAASDHFGYAVALDGDTALVSARDQNSSQGSAYAFTRSGATWSEQQKLTASDGEAIDYFGESVALDGDTALVGAYSDKIGTKISQGSAYVFTRSGATWSEQQKLTASDGAAFAYFGRAVALEGDTALIGAFHATFGPNTYQGSAYIFVRSGTIWSEQGQLLASDGAGHDYFGYAVALDGDMALVGAPADEAGPNPDQGFAYLFTRSGTDWSEQQKLTGCDRTTGDYFGMSVALNGDTALVGAKYDFVGPNASQGSAYLFTRSGSGWSFQLQLTAPDGAAGDYFGVSVALDGDTALVGADNHNGGWGAVYVFTRNGTTWTLQQKLTPSDPSASPYFGQAVALSGDTALVGSPYNSSQGSVYVFVRSGTTWSEHGPLVASDGAAGDSFGYSVALDGDTALVGAYYHDNGANSDQGSAYIFTRSGPGWTEQRLLASDGARNDWFGYAVALDGDTALVGARGDDVGLNIDQGSAYVFTRSGATWSEQQKLTASQSTGSDCFGHAVALSGNTALVGAPWYGAGARDNEGAAYVFARAGSAWSEQQQIVATDRAVGNLSGFALAFDGDTALIGAPENAGRAGAAFFYRADATPTVAAITRAGASPTSAESVSFHVMFSEVVSGVDAGDFAPTATGTLSGASVSAVSGAGATYTVTVVTGNGQGTLRLDVPATATVADVRGLALSDLPFTSGEAYTIERVVDEEFYLFLPLTVQRE